MLSALPFVHCGPPHPPRLTERLGWSAVGRTGRSLATDIVNPISFTQQNLPLLGKSGSLVSVLQEITAGEAFSFNGRFLDNNQDVLQAVREQIQETIKSDAGDVYPYNPHRPYGEEFLAAFRFLCKHAAGNPHLPYGYMIFSGGSRGTDQSKTTFNEPWPPHQINVLETALDQGSNEHKDHHKKPHCDADATHQRLIVSSPKNSHSTLIDQIDKSIKSRMDDPHPKATKRKNPSDYIGFIFPDQIREMNELYGVPEVRLDVSTAHQMGNPQGRLPVGGTLEDGEVIVPPTVLDNLIMGKLLFLQQYSTTLLRCRTGSSCDDLDQSNSDIMITPPDSSINETDSSTIETDSGQGSPIILVKEEPQNLTYGNRVNAQQRSDFSTKDWLIQMEGPTITTMDLDAWNLTIEPEFLTQYLSPIASINLAHHATKIRDDEEFKDWVHVSTGGCLIRMPSVPDYKFRLLQYLRSEMNVISHISSYPQVLNTGSPVITCRMIQQALMAIGVPRIRLNSYGMKSPVALVEANLGEESLIRNPSITQFNTFDIGFTYKCDKIVLANLSRRTLGLDGYPMLLALGKGFGTVLIRPFNSPIIRIKGYPCLVHALKATSSKHMKNVPKFTNTWRARMKELRRKLKILRENDPLDLCGFRFEATVKASTFEEAKQIVIASGCLTFQHYFAPDTSEPHTNDQLQFLVIEVDDYFRYVEEILVKVGILEDSVDKPDGITQTRGGVIVGGSQRLALVCNNKDNCSYSVKKSREAESLLREWIISLKFRLLPTHHRRGPRGERTNWKGPSPTPEPWEKPLHPQKPQKITRPTNQIEQEENKSKDYSRPRTRAQTRLIAEKVYEESIPKAGTARIGVKKEFVTHYWPPPKIRKETIYSFSKCRPCQPTPPPSIPIPILKYPSVKGSMHSKKKTVSLNPIKRVRVFEDISSVRESLLKSVQDDLKGVLPLKRVRRRKRSTFSPSNGSQSPLDEITKPSENCSPAEDIEENIFTEVIVLNNPNPIPQLSTPMQPWKKFMQTLSKLRVSKYGIQELPRMNIPSKQPDGLMDGWRLSHGFIKPDGSCLFRAISLWHFGEQDKQDKIRSSCWEELKSNRNTGKYWQDSDRGSWDEFLQTTLKGGDSPDDRKAWGGEDHIAPIANSLGVAIVVFNLLGGFCMTYTGSDNIQPLKTYFLCLVNQNHYEILFNPKLHFSTTPMTPPSSAKDMSIFEISQLRPPPFKKTRATPNSEYTKQSNAPSILKTFASSSIGRDSN
ncbi:hypothetical protein PGTUg99_001362 [Puccinia graminis f. sp. tritici]|uniref:OTU domain-containing protein n=1 Tax=Puccinia graminis f. sp. tritici TaxID=56615 RepID=A0A5B0PPL8_PUCGR|nr:hypothetical protein PGTUg99_001362 [Puccinia graminis f. sp. tritici]